MRFWLNSEKNGLMKVKKERGWASYEAVRAGVKIRIYQFIKSHQTTNNMIPTGKHSTKYINRLTYPPN